MSLRMSDLAKRLFRRPARRADRVQLRVEGLEDRTVPAAVFINEIHYANDGPDVQEFVEVAGTAGTDLTGWTVHLYDGSTGTPYFTYALGGVIPNLQNGFGVLATFLPSEAIFDGPVHGVALVNSYQQVEQLLSYGGVFTATAGPAAGLTSQNIGVVEGPGTPPGMSVHVVGTGRVASDFVWVGPAAATPGFVNAGQQVPVAPVAVTGEGNGLFGRYYAGKNFDEVRVAKVEAKAVDFNWGLAAPVAGVGTDEFSVRWTGKVQASYTGEHKFYTDTDDGVRLWVTTQAGKQLIIDKWQNQGPPATGHTSTVTVAMTAGEKYDITMEYYDNTLSAAAQLLWSNPFQTKQVIPVSQLYANTATVGDLVWVDAAATAGRITSGNPTGRSGRSG